MLEFFYRLLRERERPREEDDDERERLPEDPPERLRRDELRPPWLLPPSCDARPPMAAMRRTSSRSIDAKPRREVPELRRLLLLPPLELRPRPELLPFPPWPPRAS